MVPSRTKFFAHVPIENQKKKEKVQIAVVVESVFQASRVQLSDGIS